MAFGTFKVDAIVDFDFDFDFENDNDDEVLDEERVVFVSISSNGSVTSKLYFVLIYRILNISFSINSLY